MAKMLLKKYEHLKPDVVTLDIEMPVMNGLEALKEIMEEHPVPVVMLSSTTKIGAENTMLAMEYGAVDFVAKPGGAISLNLHEVKEEIIEKVASCIRCSDFQLTRRWQVDLRNHDRTMRNQSTENDLTCFEQLPRFDD